MVMFNEYLRASDLVTEAVPYLRRVGGTELCVYVREYLLGELGLDSGSDVLISGDDVEGLRGRVFDVCSRCCEGYDAYYTGFKEYVEGVCGFGDEVRLLNLCDRIGLVEDGVLCLEVGLGKLFCKFEQLTIVDLAYVCDGLGGFDALARLVRCVFELFRLSRDYVCGF